MLLGMAKYHHGPFWNNIDQFSRLPPLHFMLRAGDHPGVLTNLMDAGEDINGLDCHGWTLIVWALLEDRRESLEMLVSHDETRLGPTAHQTDHVFRLALRAGVKTKLILRLLADFHADVNATSSEGWTALPWCLSRQYLESVACELLRRKDVDIYNRNSQGLNVIEQIYHEGLSKQYALQVCARSDVPEHSFNRDRTVVPILMPWESKVALDPEPYPPILLLWY
ncbi:hypothetical protein GE09DRAFT_745318 [Coniochaeta sp. 2T2.1]|nr:hypothetical protein GE09DRAFT_745318 [Coniochaeta sp. 2T2.1]